MFNYIEWLHGELKLAEVTGDEERARQLRESLAVWINLEQNKPAPVVPVTTVAK